MKPCFPTDSSGKEATCQWRRHKRCRFNPWLVKILWRRTQQPTLVSPWTEESRELHSVESHRVKHDWSDLEQACTWELSVQFSSLAQSCLTLCDPMDHSMPGLPVHHQLPEFTQTHVQPAKSLQSCSTLCDPIDGSPPGSPVPGILQARTLEWVANQESISSGTWREKKFDTFLGWSLSFKRCWWSTDRKIHVRGNTRIGEIWIQQVLKVVAIR